MVRAKLDAPSLDEVRAAVGRVRAVALRTPLVPLDTLDAPGRIHLKLESLQPIGSFKLRGAANAMASAPPEVLAGVYTASAGNMAQGLAFTARRAGVPCRVLVPETAPATKLAAIERLGASYTKLPFDRWWQVMVDHGYEGMPGLFVHPFADRAVMAGNGTIGLELLEDLPDLDAVVVPYGGGGLSCGIAAAVKALRPSVKVYAAEVETAAPVAASFAAGEPRTVPYAPSFVDGIGSKGVLAEMWPIVSRLLDGSIAVTVAEVAAAVKLLAERNRVIAEGAGAAGVAAALTGRAGGGTIACVVSGGNIDSAKLCAILRGEIPI